MKRTSAIGIDWGPLTRMIPRAPPDGVEGAQIVEVTRVKMKNEECRMKNEKMQTLNYLQQRQLYFIKDDANKIVNLIFIACVSLEGAAIGYHHADSHGAMSK